MSFTILDSSESEILILDLPQVSIFSDTGSATPIA
tara:strand:+ start:234 stop:338 length:105 start_codon:yes stop_codon:yes gene_type:complete